MKVHSFALEDYLTSEEVVVNDLWCRLTFNLVKPFIVVNVIFTSYFNVPIEQILSHALTL